MTDWRQLFASLPNNSLDFIPPQIVEGVPTVVPPCEVFDAGAQEWKFSLVAQFLGKPPNFSILHCILSKLWEKKGFVNVHLLNSPLYLIQFESAAARDWVLENGPWHVHHNSMILRKWEPNLGRLHLDLDKLPLWIHLRHVPLELFTKTSLSYLASALGVPLYMDSITAARKCLAFAKVCVEIEASCPIPDQIPVMLGNGSLSSIAVSVPWKPHCCSLCHRFGHVDAACSKATSGKTTQVWQPKISVAKDDSVPKDTPDAGALLEAVPTTEYGFNPSQVAPPPLVVASVTDMLLMEVPTSENGLESSQVAHPSLVNSDLVELGNSEF